MRFPTGKGTGLAEERPIDSLRSRRVRQAPVISLLLTAIAAIVTGCGGADTSLHAPPESVSPSARLETTEMLLEDMGTTRHVADGGGRAWLEGGPQQTVVNSPGCYTVVYEAGPHGVAVGGAVYLLVSPFWGWSRPQTVSAELPGFTRVSSDAEGVELRTEVLDAHLLGITIAGRELAPGEQLRVVYGAGAAGASADDYAESDSRLWIAVDGDGDGVRSVVADSPGVEVVAGRPARVVLTLPSVARPGDVARLTIAVLDAAGNAGVAFSGAVDLVAEPASTELPEHIELEPGDRGLAQLDFVPREEGTLRITARTGSGLAGTSNPMVITEGGAKVYWGDLHGHSGLSDGTGTPEDYMTYARDVAALDVVALTDHDHWGILFLDREPELWQEIKAQTRRFHQPGRFVTLLGYEWTNWVHGHRHVLYFTDDGEVLSSLDPDFDTPSELWSALAGRPALTFAHHSAGGPVATNWDFAPDPELEPVTEISSVHGSSEALDSPSPVYSSVPGNFVRDILDRGHRLGFVGSGDGHDGHPGLAHLGAPNGGLAAIVADELSRDGVLAALRSRRVYATNGPRILLRLAVGGKPMGSIVEIDGETPLSVFTSVVGTAPIDRVELIRSGEIMANAAGEERLELQLGHELVGLTTGEYVYIRVVQVDGGAAWSSPVFFE